MEPAVNTGSIPCGSEPARDGVFAFSAELTARTPSREGSLPQVLRVLPFVLLSLLAGCAGHTIDSRGYDETGTASYYGAKHHGKRTASGEPFDQHALTAAHRELPFGTRVKVTNLNNAKTVVVRINDRGPHTRGRLIDLSRAAADQLGMLQSGTARVRVQALSD